MKKLILLLAVFSCTVFSGNAQILPWSGYPAGGTTYTTGIMTATVTSVSPGFQNGTPKYYPSNTIANDQCGIAGGLALEHKFGNITNAHSTLTMDFTSGGTTNGLCGNISFQIKDINSEESFQSFADWVEVSAIDGNNNPVPIASITASGGGTNVTITDNGSARIVKGYSSGAYLSRSSQTCNDVTFAVAPPAGATLKSVILKYHPDYTAAPSDYYSFTGPKRPAYQYISISPITVNATAGPTAVVITTTDASCTQNNGTVTIGAVTGGVSPYQFNFNNLGLSGTTGFTGLAGGTYPVVVRDNNGCLLNATATINISGGPTAATIAHVDASCGQVNGTVTIGAITGGTAPYRYNFNNLGLSTTTAFSALGAGTYPVIVEDNNGCTYNTTVTVGNASGPTAIAINHTNAACSLSDGSVTLSTVTGGVAPYQYNFNGLGFASTTSFSSLAAGTYPVIVKDNNGCTYNTSVVVSNAAGPTAIVTSVIHTTCGGTNGAVQLGNVTGGTAPYQYNFNGTGFAATTNYPNLAAGTYPVIVKDNGGCLYNTSVTVNNTGNGPTAVASTVNNASCGQTNGAVQLGSVTGGTAPYQYNFNGAGFAGATNYPNLGAGTYPLIVKDNNGCNYSTTITVGAGNGPSAVVVTVTGDMCSQSNGSVVLGAVTGGIAPYQYNFNGQGLGTSTSFTNLATGTYPVVVSDANGCTFNTSAVVPAILGPSAATFNTTPESCQSMNGTLIMTSVTDGTAPYEMNFNNLGYTSAHNCSGLIAGTYPVSVKDANGCVFTTTVVIGATASGPSDLSVHAVVPACGAVNGSIEILQVTGGTAPYTYSLNGGTGTSTVLFPGLLSGTYTLLVEDANGCTYSESVVLLDGSETESLRIPNVFSPDGDNINENWFIGGNCVKELECVILNRWGEVMETFDDLSDQWDGIYKGKKVLEGTYFYKVKVTFWSGKTEDYHGHITVVY